MHLVWLLAIPALLFAGALIGKGILELTLFGEGWWRFPLYMALMGSFGLAWIAALLMIVSLAFGLHP